MLNDAHLIFIKYPESGRVKTRLGKEIGMEKAASLYKSMVENILTSCRSKDFHTVIFYDPKEKFRETINWLGTDYSYMPQRGGSLGERMSNALSDAFLKGFNRCLLTGSDIPELSKDILKQGFAELKNSDAVIGKAEDGGYYLIGFKRETYTDAVFRGITWSTPVVFSETMTIFENINYNVSMTRVLSDIDLPEDIKNLEEFRHMNRPG